jgi:hypothetical protein
MGEGHIQSAYDAMLARLLLYFAGPFNVYYCNVAVIRHIRRIELTNEIGVHPGSSVLPDAHYFRKSPESLAKLCLE